MSVTDPPKTLLPIRLPMAEAFFAGALSSRSLAHGYILKGKACGRMYNLALEVARITNCTNRPPVAHPAGLSELACGECTDCRWVAQNAHPAVLTISRLTYQVSEKGEDLSPEDLEKQSKKASVPTMIKTDQVERLLHQLALSSQYTRVVIFIDAEVLPSGMASEVTAPYEWRGIEANADKSFHIRPLERKLFNAASANRFLKTLEEPPPRTLFFFIVETEEQLLETIVSRCQVVPCLSGEAPGDDFEAFPPEYAAFLEALVVRVRQNQDVYASVGEFEQFFVGDAGLSLAQSLEVFQAFLRRRYLQRTLDPAGFTAYKSVQEALDTALSMLAARAHEAQTLLHLFLKLSVPLYVLRDD